MEPTRGEAKCGRYGVRHKSDIMRCNLGRSAGVEVQMRSNMDLKEELLMDSIWVDCVLQPGACLFRSGCIRVCTQALAPNRSEGLCSVHDGQDNSRAAHRGPGCTAVESRGRALDTGLASGPARSCLQSEPQR